MKATIQKWGNSLAVRIPKFLAAEAGVEYGSAVEMTLDEDGLRIRPLRTALSLDVLLADVRPDNLHGEVDSGGSVGREELA